MQRHHVPILLLLSHLAATSAHPQALKAVLVSSTQSTPADDSLRSIVAGLLPQITVSGAPRFRSVDLIQSNYRTPCAMLSKAAIGTLTPLRYVQCKEKLGDTLLPLFVVKKRHEQTAYYSAFFVSDKHSSISGIRDTSHIRGIVLVDSNSVSGYLAPLYQLFEEGLIRTPSIEGVRQRGWKVEFAGSQREAVARVQQDVAMIAGIGGFPDQDAPERAPVRVLLRYATLPQDVFFISSDLSQSRDKIASWLLGMLAKDSSRTGEHAIGEVLARSSSQLTGVVPFEREHANAYDELRLLAERVKGKSPLPIFKFSTEMHISDLLESVSQLTIGSIFSAFGVLASYSLFWLALGHQFGGPIMAAVGKIKRLWSDPLKSPLENHKLDETRAE